MTLDATLFLVGKDGRRSALFRRATTKIGARLRGTRMEVFVTLLETGTVLIDVRRDGVTVETWSRTAADPPRVPAEVGPTQGTAA